MLFYSSGHLESKPRLKYIKTTTDKSQDGYGVLCFDLRDGFDGGVGRPGCV